MDFADNLKTVSTEIEITDKMLLRGNQIMNLELPDNTLVVMVKRGDNYFLPSGSTTLKEKDKLLIITDNQEALVETYRNLGIDG